MKYYFLIKITAIIALVVLGTACDDDLSSIGGEIIDIDPNNGFTTEEIAIIAYNERVENVQVSGLPGALVGVNNDPVFGNSVHSVLAKAALTTYDPSFGTNPILLSVVVNIPYFSTLESSEFEDSGETTNTYSLDSIFNANEEAKLSLYYSDYFLSDLDPENLEQQNRYFSQEEFPDALLQALPIIQDTIFSPSSAEVLVPNTVVCDTDDEEEKSAPAFQVTIEDQAVLEFFTENILNKEGDIELSNANNFQEFFRGFYLKATPKSEGAEGALAYLDLSRASVNLIYNIDPEEPDDPEDPDNCLERPIRSFPIAFSDTQVNIVEGNFNESIAAKIEAQDSISGASSLYLKGGAGAIAVLEIFPGDQNERFAELQAEKVILNDATIKFYVDGTLTGLPSDYQRIYIYDYESGAPLVDLLVDPLFFQADPSTAFSTSLGMLERDDIGHFYEVNLTQHVNNLIYNSDENSNRKLGLCVTQNAGLPLATSATGGIGIDTGAILDFQNSKGETRVLPAGSVIEPDGIILYGNATTDVAKRLKLNLVYTKPIN